MKIVVGMIAHYKTVAMAVPNRPETRRQNGGVSSLASVLFGIGHVCGMTDHEVGIRFEITAKNSKIANNRMLGHWNCSPNLECQRTLPTNRKDEAV